MNAVDRETICQNRPTPDLPTAKLHHCKTGVWVGITDRLYADAINSLWVEGFHVDVVGISGGLLQVVVREGLCGHDRCDSEVFAA